MQKKRAAKNQELNMDLKLSPFTADPVERIFKATRAYLDAPTGIADIKMYAGFSERMEPAIVVRLNGMDYGLLYKEALIVADVLEHVRKHAKLEGESSMINGLRMSAEGARKNMVAG
jgi:hypothetical protein